MSFSSFLPRGFPGMLNDDDDGDNKRPRASIMDLVQNTFCCPGATTVDDCSIQELPQAGENNTDRSSNQSWKPPRYRDKSLLADASCCFVQDSTVSSPSNFQSSSVVSVSCDQSASSQDGTCPQMPTNEDTDLSNCLRAAFIPPKHIFSLSFKRKKCHESVQSLSPKSSGLRLRPEDVVCGRGANTSAHPGNVEFKRIIKQNEMRYIFAKRNEKPNIAQDILTTFRFGGARFVKREKNKKGDFEWVEIKEEKALEKVCQSLREKAPDLKRKMVAAEAKRDKRAQKRSRGQYQSLQGRQDSSSSYSNGLMNDYDLRHQPSFASQQQRNSWSDEPHNISNAGRHHQHDRDERMQQYSNAGGSHHHDRDERMQYYEDDNSEHYNHIHYCTALLPPHLGGERLFGDRQQSRWE